MADDALIQRESLLAKTDAIPRQTVAFEPYRGGVLVRYRRVDGAVEREIFQDREEAHRYFLRCVGKLKAEARGGLNG